MVKLHRRLFLPLHKSKALQWDFIALYIERKSIYPSLDFWVGLETSFAPKDLSKCNGRKLEKSMDVWVGLLTIPGLLLLCDQS